MKRFFTAILAVMMIAMLGVPAFAAEAPETAETAEPVDTVESLTTTPEETEMEETAVAPSPKLYPAEVVMKEENGALRLEKVYILRASDDPAGIDTADFERDGCTYTLLDILKNDLTESETKDHIEVLTKETDTKDLSKILPLFAPTLELSTEDGYAGVLTLDHTSITVEAAGYASSTRTVSATRTYPNLSDADVSLVPKTVEESGRTLTLSDVKWESAAANTVDGYELAIRYTATATYTGTATSSYATGYIATANYVGEITKSTSDTVIYTAVFAGEPKSGSSDDTAGGIMDNLLPDTDEPAEDTGDGFQFNWKWLAIPIAGAIAAGGYFGYKYYLDKKRGYK